jgi:hypothetical protein
MASELLSVKRVMTIQGPFDGWSSTTIGGLFLISLGAYLYRDAELPFWSRVCMEGTRAIAAGAFDKIKASAEMPPCQT